ncbi:MAG TPA: hypothetical protein VFZ02_11760 [Ktedonobacteraceae bacterium]
MLEDKHTTGEINEQDRQLVQVLQRIYDTRAEDAQSLERIRERLLTISAGSLPVSDHDLTTATTPPLRTEKARSQGTKKTNIRFIRSTFDGKKTWLRPLSTIAAVLLVAIIVGSLALLLIRLRQDTTGNGSRVFSLRQGWMQLALYSGRGSKTITGQNIELPRLWGDANTCVGTGKLNIELTGKQTMMNMGRDSCQSALSTIVAPQSISFEVSASTPQIQTIKVTVDANTKWHLLIVQAMTQPALTIGPEWIHSIGIGGDGSSSEAVASVGAYTNSAGQTILPKTWGMVFVCTGTGNGHIQFIPDHGVGKIALPPCDEQPRLILVRYHVPTSVESVQFFITGNVLWNAQILGCADEHKCTT